MGAAFRNILREYPMRPGCTSHCDSPEQVKEEAPDPPRASQESQLDNNDVVLLEEEEPHIRPEGVLPGRMTTRSQKRKIMATSATDLDSVPPKAPKRFDSRKSAKETRQLVDELALVSSSFPKTRRRKSPQIVPLDAMPLDALRLVFQHCDGRSLQALTCTCKRFSKITGDERMWMKCCEKELPYRLIGLQSVHDLRQSSSVPWSRVYTTLSSILQHDLVSSTGLSLENKNIQQKLVTSMGGQFQSFLDRKVTVLVVAQTGTDKYKFALKERDKIALVTEQWVFDCFASGKRLDPANYKPHIFLGLRFCATQIQPGVRQYIEEEAVSRGGTYTADLQRDHNTHLIAVRPEGRKFEYAHKWNIKVVSPQWFFRCLEEREFQDEREFIIPFPSPPSDHVVSRRST
eukprot:c5476_g1_i1.p1 GENE.c5476_g1_i1~~c5476_g1_i1.p1  ORF type:complete len:403 (-),score=77.48 c5476_g1_i1:425-1633(-)